MAEPTNMLMDAFRPRYGSANVGYDMAGAQQYPPITEEDLRRLGILGAGAGIGGFTAAPFMASQAALARPVITGMGYPMAGNAAANSAGAAGAAAFGGGAVGLGALGARDLANATARSIRNRGDAQNQDGGFYGPPTRVDPRDAEGQPGGFYGPPVNHLMRR